MLKVGKRQCLSFMRDTSGIFRHCKFVCLFLFGLYHYNYIIVSGSTGASIREETNFMSFNFRNTFPLLSSKVFPFDVKLPLPSGSSINSMFVLHLRLWVRLLS